VSSPDAFDRLSPALRHQIVNTLGFRSLRPVQELAIGPILDGDNCVVLAPTAGGKTEAAFFPLLSAIDTNDWRPLSTIYLSPIRALLNNQETRVAHYAGLIGRRAFKWHGDTGTSERKRFLRDPADILLTTPESIEAMLMSDNVPSHSVFQHLRTVIIDEVHSFADDDRGAHLAALLERLSRFCRRDLQRIGLSATVGNPGEILQWLSGRSQRRATVIDPPKQPKAPELSLDYVGNVSNAVQIIRALHPGKKRLVFADSRRTVEELGRSLNDAGVDTFVSHGSLSASQRRDAERAFHEGRDCVIVATSALELGIDVGDLDHVLQIDCPSSVASFLQRMGRTGRRADTVPNCTFLATKNTTLLQAAALVNLYRQGFVEPVRPSARASHILAHQLMALSIQSTGVGRRDWFAWLEGASPFAGLTPADRDTLVSFMLEREVLADHGGKLWLGSVGEKLYAGRNFEALYAVFETPRLIIIRWNAQDIGTVEAQFLEGLETTKGTPGFTLAGRPWTIVTIDWNRGLCAVEPSEYARAARWAGLPRFLSYELCQAMRRILTSDDIDPTWSRRARETLAAMRGEYAFLRDEPSPMLSAPEEITWHTYAGGKANLLLARMIEADLGGRCVVRNTSIACRDAAGQSVAALRNWVAEAAAQSRPNLDDLRRHARTAARTRVSKFQPCLPDILLDDIFAERVVDGEGARKALNQSASGNRS
jgi:ATP-dependent helicase Lhr and Lhr-like helicase